MDEKHLVGAIEAILFVAGDPVGYDDLANALGVDRDTLIASIDSLDNEYRANRRGICVRRTQNDVQLTTNAHYSDEIKEALSPLRRRSLSQSSLETLAIIAYKQPITKPEIEAIRGVKCDYSVASLSGKGLISTLGRSEALGRPVLYGTTDAFLRYFNITSLSELPELLENPPAPEDEDDYLSIL